jgi:tetratricopeptide (TPR) repeat protein
MKRKSNKIHLLFTALSSLLILKSVLAQVPSQVFVGTRPLSMGEAFVAVADDGHAISWNPAGLARLERMQASFAYAELFSLGIDSYYASFFSRLYLIPLLTDYVTVGADWSGIKAGDEEFGFSRDQFNFSLAFKPPDMPFLRDLSLGLNAKRLSMNVELDSTRVGGGSGWGWDFGVLYNLSALRYVPKGLHVGLMTHDVGGTRVTHETKSKETIQRQNIRWGLSYRPFEDWPGGKIPISDPIVALDFDDRVHFGLEFWLARTLALRAGIQKDFHTDEKVILSFGLGIKTKMKDWPEAHVDYALTDSPVLPNTNKHFGGSLILRENPRLIRIEEVHINDVFASLYRHYGLHGASIGKIKIKNDHNETLIARITFLASRYMKPQAPDTVVIEPERTIDFPLRAVFEPEILNAPEGRLAGEVKVTYEYKKNEYASTVAIDFALYGKNYLTWDDPGKAAAFVTFDDPLVRSFVDKALAKKPDTLGRAQWFSRYRMADALTIFNALQAYGLEYRMDPVTPFSLLADTLRGARYRLDKIQYPAELLSREKGERSGDCDDLSVLYASLLQYVGLPTALVSGPGHIFMMFDTGIPESQMRTLPVSPALFVKKNGNLWISVEATMIPTSSFTEAWATAAARFKSGAKDTNWEIFEVAACQSVYPPVAPRFEEEPPSSTPDFVAALQRDFISLEAMKEQYLQKLEAILERPLPPVVEAKARNTYGVVLGQTDDYARAKEQFQKLLAKNPTYAPAWNNLGNVDFILGNFTEAERWYNKALECNRFSRGTYLNLAILYQMMIIGASAQESVGYQRKTDEALLKAAQLLEGDTKSAYAILGFPEERLDGKAGSFVDKVKKRIRQVKEFVDESFKKYLQKQEIKVVVIDKHGAKGRGDVDEDRWALLAWIY